MRTIELAYALHMPSVSMDAQPQRDYRAGATSSYKLVDETVLVVAILRALRLVIGTSVTITADVHLEVPQVLSNALSQSRT